MAAVPGYCLMDVVDRALTEFSPPAAGPYADNAELFSSFDAVFDSTGGFGVAGGEASQAFGACDDCGSTIDGTEVIDSQFGELTEGWGEMTGGLDSSLPIGDFVGDVRDEIRMNCLGSWGPKRPREGHVKSTSDLAAMAKVMYRAADLAHQAGIFNYHYLLQLAGDAVSVDAPREKISGFLGDLGLPTPVGVCTPKAPVDYLRLKKSTEIHTRMKFQELFPAIDTCEQIGSVPAQLAGGRQARGCGLRRDGPRGQDHGRELADRPRDPRGAVGVVSLESTRVLLVAPGDRDLTRNDDMARRGATVRKTIELPRRDADLLAEIQVQIGAASESEVMRRALRQFARMVLADGDDGVFLYQPKEGPVMRVVFF